MRPDELRELLETAGFTVSEWSDATEAGRAWFAAQAAKIGREGPPRLGAHVLLGGDFQAMAGNVVRNLHEGRIVLGQVVATR